MKKYFLYSLAIILLATNMILLVTQRSTAQSKNFYTVVPFVTQAGRMGFFDQENGKIYIYDNDVKSPLFVAQLTDLGMPIEQIDRVDNKTSDKYGEKSKSIIIGDTETDEKEKK